MAEAPMKRVALYKKHNSRSLPSQASDTPNGAVRPLDCSRGRLRRYRPSLHRLDAGPGVIDAQRVQRDDRSETERFESIARRAGIEKQ